MRGEGECVCIWFHYCQTGSAPPHPHQQTVRSSWMILHFNSLLRLQEVFGDGQSIQMVFFKQGSQSETMCWCSLIWLIVDFIGDNSLLLVKSRMSLRPQKWSHSHGHTPMTDGWWTLAHNDETNSSCISNADYAPGSPQSFAHIGHLSSSQPRS